MTNLWKLRRGNKLVAEMGFVLAFSAVVSLALAACDWIDPGPPAYRGIVAETRGECWSIIGDAVDGKRVRYAVKAEDGKRLGLKAGERVTIRGKVAATQDCAAAVVLAPEA